jgi:hypothetical protein
LAADAFKTAQEDAMSFWKTLFGGSPSPKAAMEPEPVAEESYKGFTVKALIMHVGGEYQLAGRIEKEVDGELRVHKFIRADRMSSKEDVVSLSLAKGRQIVDEQGERMFAD